MNMWQNTPRKMTAQDKLEVCRRCPFVKHTAAVGLTCGTLLNPEYDHRGQQLTCGCILQAKVRVPGQHCPQNKW
tara:strand:- start:4134 stop:4355 length:222 start_codon:yes stop_codon:yes gene_type:complete